MSYCGVIDLRGPTEPTCWTEARTVPERVLVERLVSMFRTASIDELVDEYVNAYHLPPRLLGLIRAYMQQAEKREQWTVRYFEVSAQRYARRLLGGQAALEAGCGSGGGLPHLAARFARVVGVDVDLAALIIAARRCIERGVSERVSLAAAMLEQRIFMPNTFDAIKSTDVIEHVADLSRAYSRMLSALKIDGTLFVLTPNKWNLLSPEPHVGLWGVQVLPSSMADWYVRRRIGVAYRSVASLLSYRQFLRSLELEGTVDVLFVPIEDKHFNPESRRGRFLWSAFQLAPLAWVSRCLRPLQPTLEAICIKRAEVQ